MIPVLFAGGLSRRIGSSLDSLDTSEMETSALLKTHLFQTNLSRDSGLTSSDTQLYSEHMEPHAIPATALQVRKKSLTRSTSQFDEVKPKQEEPMVLSNSYDSSLNVAREATGDIPPPVPPPRKSRRKAPEPPANVRPFHGDNSTNVQLKENSNEETVVSTSNNAKPNLTITKQRSSESIGSSLDDNSGSVDSGDYPDGHQLNPVKMDTLQCNDYGELRKSASGAKIYLDEQLISDSSPSGNHRQSASNATNSSSLPSKQNDHKDIKRTPPPMREPPSYEESVLRTRGKAAEIRAKSANRSSWNEQSPRKGQSSAVHIHPHQLKHETYRSVDNLHNMHQRTELENVADRYSSMQELHRDHVSKSDEGAYIRASLALRGGDGTPPQIMYTPPEPKHSARDPVLKTLLAEGENKEEVMRKVRVGMTAKGGDIFPKHMRSIIRHSLHEDELTSKHKGSRGRVVRKAGSIDEPTSQVKPQRSESFATRQRPPEMARLGISRSVEKSASDTSVVDQFENNARRHGWTRPSKPPTYQEAIQRESLLKTGLPLYQVSHQDVKQQREKSSRAAQLYQESMKRYELQAEDPTQGRANEGHIPDSAQLESRPVRQQAPVRQSDGSYRREPPPTREIDHGSKTGIDALREKQQLVDLERREKRETTPSDQQRKHRDYHATKEDERINTEIQRHNVSQQQTEQVYSSKVQRRGSDPRSRNANNRNRRDHSGSNVPSSSENESCRNQQGYSDEYKMKREHAARQQTPPYRQTNNKERHGRRNKSRDQRLSDTRLDNNKTNEMHRQSRSGLTRSKSDSSEHINKIGRFKELQALDSNIIEQYRKSMLNAENEALKDSQSSAGRQRRRSINSVRNRDWHRDLAQQYSDVFYMPPPETNNNNKVIYAYAGREEINNENQVDERPKRRWQPPVHPSKDLIVVNNNNNQSQERQNSVKKEKGRRSMPPNFTNWSTIESHQEQSVVAGKENKPVVNVAVQDWRDEISTDAGFINVKERIKEYPLNFPSQSERQTDDNAKHHHQHHRLPAPAQQQHQVHAQPQVYTPKQPHVVQSQAAAYQHKQVDANRNVHPHLQRGSQVQAHVQGQSQRDTHVQRVQAPLPIEQDLESEAGLTWSVAKLRNRFSQGKSSNIFYDPTSQQDKDSRQTGKKIAREATNANANEEYI